MVVRQQDIIITSTFFFIKFWATTKMRQQRNKIKTNPWFRIFRRSSFKSDESSSTGSDSGCALPSTSCSPESQTPRNSSQSISGLSRVINNGYINIDMMTSGRRIININNGGNDSVMTSPDDIMVTSSSDVSSVYDEPQDQVLFHHAHQRPLPHPNHLQLYHHQQQQTHQVNQYHPQYPNYRRQPRMVHHNETSPSYDLQPIAPPDAVYSESVLNFFLSNLITSKRNSMASSVISSSATDHERILISSSRNNNNNSILGSPRNSSSSFESDRDETSSSASIPTSGASTNLINHNNNNNHQLQHPDGSTTTAKFHFLENVSRNVRRPVAIYDSGPDDPSSDDDYSAVSSSSSSGLSRSSSLTSEPDSEMAWSTMTPAPLTAQEEYSPFDESSTCPDEEESVDESDPGLSRSSSFDYSFHLPSTSSLKLAIPTSGDPESLGKSSIDSSKVGNGSILDSNRQKEQESSIRGKIMMMIGSDSTAATGGRLIESPRYPNRRSFCSSESKDFSSPSSGGNNNRRKKLVSLPSSLMIRGGGGERRGHATSTSILHPKNEVWVSPVTELLWPDSSHEDHQLPGPEKEMMIIGDPNDYSRNNNGSGGNPRPLDLYVQNHKKRNDRHDRQDDHLKSTDTAIERFHAEEVKKEITKEQNSLAILLNEMEQLLSLI